MSLKGSPFESFEVEHVIGYPIISFLTTLTLVFIFFLAFIAMFVNMLSKLWNLELYVIYYPLIIGLIGIYFMILGAFKDQTGLKAALKYFPIVLTTFIFVTVGNLYGLLPYAVSYTGHIGVTFSLAGIIFIAWIILGLKVSGVHFIELFIPHNCPLWLFPLMIVIELLSFFIRPFSLAIRLFANILAGHILLHIIEGTFEKVRILEISGIQPFTTPTGSVIMNVVYSLVLLLELGVACLQGYIFMLLVSIYLRDCVEPKNISGITSIQNWLNLKVQSKLIKSNWALKLGVVLVWLLVVDFILNNIKYTKDLISIGNVHEHDPIFEWVSFGLMVMIALSILGIFRLFSIYLRIINSVLFLHLVEYFTELAQALSNHIYKIITLFVQAFYNRIWKGIVAGFKSFFNGWVTKIKQQAQASHTDFLILSIILGGIFLLLQGYEYVTALFHLGDGVFGAIFYLLTGLHGLHVLVGVSLLGLIYMRLVKNSLSANNLTTIFGTFYGHFVDVIWILLFIVLYFMPVLTEYNSEIAVAIGPGLLFSSLAPHEYKAWKGFITEFRDLNKILLLLDPAGTKKDTDLVPLYSWYDKQYNRKFVEAPNKLAYARELLAKLAFDMTMIVVRNGREAMKVKKELQRLKTSPRPWSLVISQSIERKEHDLSMSSAIFPYKMEDLLELMKSCHFPWFPQFDEAFHYYTGRPVGLRDPSSEEDEETRESPSVSLSQATPNSLEWIKEEAINFFVREIENIIRNFAGASGIDLTYELLAKVLSVYYPNRDFSDPVHACTTLRALIARLKTLRDVRNINYLRGLFYRFCEGKD